MVRRRAALTVTAAAALAAVAACGSSKSSTPAASSGGPSSSTAGGSASAGGSGGGSPALAAAQKIADAAQQNPTSIGIVNSLSKKPPSGKFIALPESPQPVTHVKDVAFQNAVKQFGWRVQIIPEGTGADDAGKAFDSALALKPDMILFSGTPVALLRSQLAAAQAAKVPVLAETITDPKSGPIVDASIDGAPQVENEARILANYVAAKSSCKQNVAIFNIPAYGVLTILTNTFKETMKTICPSTKVKEVDQQISDLGTKTPQSVVSTIQRDPSITWAVFTIGDLTLGLDTALRGAGLGNKVILAGGAPTQANLAAMKAGSNQAWMGFAGPILGYRDADMAARYFNGDPLTPGGDALILPTQVITKDNVRSIVTDSNGYYQGVAGFESQFAKLWKLS